MGKYNKIKIKKILNAYIRKNKQTKLKTQK